MGQIFSSLELGNFQDPCAKADAVFIKSPLKVNFDKKNPVLAVDKFSFLALAKDMIMLQHLNGRLWKIKNKEKF